MNIDIWYIKLTLYKRFLKAHSCKLYDTKITNTEIFASVAVLVFKSLSCKLLLINRKDNVIANKENSK